MKKILALVLALLMAVSTATMALAAETADTAITEEAPKQVSAADTYAEAIAMLDAYGIMKGVDPNTFDADADSDIQRYQMALFVGRISTGWTDDAQWTDGNVNNSGFTDLDGTPAQNFYGAISYASQKGIIEGYGDKKFGPTDGITYRDALTMVDRTLGYTGLAYPWGNIEKAESLGLTKGITGVAYTDVLNRGEVAQIIYNALFVPTKDGDTLAARRFGDKIGYKTIIITKTDRAALAPVVDGSLPASGTVGFNVVAENGELEKPTYYITAADLGFSTDNHGDEAKLGAAYKVLFTVNGDAKLVNSLGYSSLFLKTEKNGGLTTKDADGKYPIEKVLSGLTLVDKYSKNNYINAYNFNGGEIIIRTNDATPITAASSNRNYAIDWKTGDILVKSKDGAIALEDGTTYKVAWYYNALLEKYFEIKEDTVKGETKIVGINILDEDDVANIMKNQFDTKAASGGFYILNKDTIKKGTAYAALDLYDLNGDKTADYGLYTQYALGLFKEEDVPCVKDSHKKAGYTITTLDALAKAAWEAYSSDPFEAAKAVSVPKEGVCGDHSTDIGYIDPDGLTPSSGDYVIYGYNDVTGELHIEKIIYKSTDEKSDENNFVGTGLVRAYDTTKKTVTIGDRTYSYDYPELLGNGMRVNSDKTASRAQYNTLLGGKFMNFVNFVVLDGQLVYIDGNVTDAPYIIVDSYAGVSADGYVVVNGWKSTDLAYTQIRIGAYDQWLKGDLYNYALRYKGDELFTKGSIYRATSYDKANDAYYVETIAAVFEKDGKLTYDIDALKAAGLLESYKVSFDENLYKKVNNDDPVRAKADDKYIIINFNENDDYGYAPITVYTGKGKAGWEIKDAYKLKGTDIIIGTKADSVTGFEAYKYAVWYGLLVSYDYDSAKYTSASEAAGKDLLGATNFTATVINLYTGEEIAVRATTKALKSGYAYACQNGQIIDDTPYGFGAKNVKSNMDIISLTEGTLLQSARNNANKYYEDTFKVDYFDKKEASKLVSQRLYSKNYTDMLPNGVTVYLVKNDGTKVTSIKKIDSDAYKAWLKETGAENPTYVAIVENDAIVFYVDGSDFGTTVVGEGEDYKSDNIFQVVEGGYIDGSVNATVTTKIDKEGNETNTAVVNSFSFWFVGAQSKVNHKEVADLDLYFGDAGLCTEESWQSTVDGKKTFNGSITDTVYGEIKDDKYSAHGDDGEDCNLVYKVTVDAAGIIGTIEENVEADATADPPVEAKDNSKTFDVVFTGYKDVNGTRTAAKYTANVTVKFVDGEFVYVINTINSYSPIDRTSTEIKW